MYMYHAWYWTRQAKEIFQRDDIAFWRQFRGCITPVVVHTQLQTGRNDPATLSEMSFGMYNIHIPVQRLRNF